MAVCQEEKSSCLPEFEKTVSLPKLRRQSLPGFKIGCCLSSLHRFLGVRQGLRMVFWYQLRFVSISHQNEDCECKIRKTNGLEAIPCLDNKYLVYVVTNIFMKKYQYHHNNILTGIKYHNMFTLTYSLNKCIIPYLQVVHITILLYTNFHFVYFLCRAQTSFVRKVCII